MINEKQIKKEFVEMIVNMSRVELNTITLLALYELSYRSGKDLKVLSDDAIKTQNAKQIRLALIKYKLLRD